MTKHKERQAKIDICKALINKRDASEHHNRRKWDRIIEIYVVSKGCYVTRQKKGRRLMFAVESESVSQALEKSRHPGMAAILLPILASHACGLGTTKS